MRLRLPRSARKWLRLNEGRMTDLITLALALLFAGIGFYLFFVAKVVTLDAYLAFMIATLAPLLSYWMYATRKRKQAALITITSAYLLEEFRTIDEVLGHLIAGKISLQEIDPLDRFFTTLRRLCEHGAVEARRRIAEALPTLLQIDADLTIDLAEVLRQDYDDARWKADNRRRVIEALPHFLKVDSRAVWPMLRLTAGDDIFVIIAIVEVLDAMQRNGCRKTHDPFRDIKRTMRMRHFPEEQLFAVTELWDLLEYLRSDATAAVAEFRRFTNSPNSFVRLCVARNLRRVCRHYPSCKTVSQCRSDYTLALDMVEHFLRAEEDKQVRRPIAREDSLDCLLVLLGIPECCERIMSIIASMVIDQDDIIRTTVFDKIDNIMDADPAFAYAIAEYVADNEEGLLKSRALSVLGR